MWKRKRKNSASTLLDAPPKNPEIDHRCCYSCVEWSGPFLDPAHFKLNPKELIAIFRLCDFGAVTHLFSVSKTHVRRENPGTLRPQQWEWNVPTCWGSVMMTTWLAINKESLKISRGKEWKLELGLSQTQGHLRVPLHSASQLAI